jgi:6-phosphogluconate dehydrogenase
MTHRRFIVEKAEIGLIGLAVMGSNLALNIA